MNASKMVRAISNQLNEFCIKNNLDCPVGYAYPPEPLAGLFIVVGVDELDFQNTIGDSAMLNIKLECMVASLEGRNIERAIALMGDEKYGVRGFIDNLRELRLDNSEVIEVSAEAKTMRTNVYYTDNLYVCSLKVRVLN